VKFAGITRPTLVNPYPVCNTKYQRLELGFEE
jgi:hypothetical protein